MPLHCRIILESPLGARSGQLCLEVQNGRVSGTLSLLGYENPVSGRQREDGRLVLDHDLRTAVSVFPCQSILEWNGSTLTGTTRTQRGTFTWQGGALEEERSPIHGKE